MRLTFKSMHNETRFNSDFDLENSYQIWRRWNDRNTTYSISAEME